MAEEKDTADRVAAYTDAVFAVIVTIMVLDGPIVDPAGGETRPGALRDIENPDVVRSRPCSRVTGSVIVDFGCGWGVDGWKMAGNGRTG